MKHNNMLKFDIKWLECDLCVPCNRRYYTNVNVNVIEYLRAKKSLLNLMHGEKMT